MVKQYDIITLDNNKEYSVVELTYIDDTVYMVGVEVDEEENLIPENIIYLKIIDDEVYQIQDEEEIKRINECF